MVNNEELLRKLEEAEHRNRELLRELNQATKDARQALKEHKEQLNREADNIVGETVNAAVRIRLDELAVSTKTAMDRSVAKVAAEFTRLENAFLGKEKRNDKPSLEDLINHLPDA